MMKLHKLRGEGGEGGGALKGYDGETKITMKERRADPSVRVKYLVTSNYGDAYNSDSSPSRRFLIKLSLIVTCHEKHASLKMDTVLFRSEILYRLGRSRRLIRSTLRNEKHF